MGDEGKASAAQLPQLVCRISLWPHECLPSHALVLTGQEDRVLEQTIGDVIVWIPGGKKDMPEPRSLQSQAQSLYRDVPTQASTGGS